MSSDAAVTVIKLGGTMIDGDEGPLAGLAALAASHRMVLVHGGGKRLTSWLERLGITSRFEGGLRVTDDAALEVAVAVFGLVNAELVAALQRQGVRAVGMSGIDGGLIVGRRVPALGRVIHVLTINRAPLDALWAGGFLPAVAPLAVDEAGVICNVNADDAAGGLAAGLGARLLLLTDTAGVLDSDGGTIAQLDTDGARDLIDSGTVIGGMVPKVRAALDALASGAAEVVIADGRGPGAVVAALGASPHGTRIQ